MLYKICRICLNSEKWVKPTPKMDENEASFTSPSKSGFGYEEWLNRGEWLLSGYEGLEGEWRYVYLQGMFTPKNAYVGEDVSILFYVKRNGSKFPPMAVAHLENAYAIGEKEAEWAKNQFSQKKWIELMHAEVEAVGGNVAGLNIKKPLHFINIRFRPGSLKFFDEPRIINVNSFHYTTALNWDGVIPTNVFDTPPVNVIDYAPSIGGQPSDEILNRFSEEIYERRCASGKLVVPRQAPIQNALAMQLHSAFSSKGYRVTCEDQRVDMKLFDPNGFASFIEIKPASSAREAIRLALGQLIEYSHYPAAKRADKLIIVSDASPSVEDIGYIDLLRITYNLPLEYVHWPLGATALSQGQLASFL